MKIFFIAVLGKKFLIIENIKKVSNNNICILNNSEKIYIIDIIINPIIKSY